MDNLYSYLYNINYNINKSSNKNIYYRNNNKF